MIRFNIPYITGAESQNIMDAINSRQLCGENRFSFACSDTIKSIIGGSEVKMVPSGTHALEMAAILSQIGYGDEVIMPSFTFSSTANAFVLRGARIKFVDIRPDTLNLNEDLIEGAITERTKAIIVVHYAGVAAEMERIMKVAKLHNLVVVEDAAQCLLSYYRGRHLGTFGEVGCFSFHETKNIQCGEGGAILINKEELIDRSNTIMEKGTDRRKFINGEVDKYSWKDVGSSFLMNEITAAFLYAQLQKANEITDYRLKLWESYKEELKNFDKIETPDIPSHCRHNGHIFYIKLENERSRDRIQKYLRDKGIQAVPHYVPLHSSSFGLKVSSFNGEDVYTTKESSRILRLPLHNNMSNDDVLYVSRKIRDFFKEDL